jgi:hypothetical protein
MTSSKQFNANRQNATLSTGPRSEQGKQVSSNNSLTHGLTAKQVVIEGEDAEGFDWLLEGLLEQFAPGTILEQQLIEQLAGYFWRLRRIPALEGAILEAHLQAIRSQHKSVVESHMTFGRALVRDAFGYDAFSKLSRYEVQLINLVERTIKQLDKLREEGLVEPTSSTQIVDL